MEFDEKTHKCKWWLDDFTKDEARAYISFLDAERWRHELAVKEASEETCERRLRSTTPRIIALVEFWQSAIKRHQEDVKEIRRLIQAVKWWHKI